MPQLPSAERRQRDNRHAGNVGKQHIQHRFTVEADLIPLTGMLIQTKHEPNVRPNERFPPGSFHGRDHQRFALEQI